MLGVWSSLQLTKWDPGLHVAGCYVYIDRELSIWVNDEKNLQWITPTVYAFQDYNIS